MPKNPAAQAVVDEVLSASSQAGRHEATIAFKTAMPAQPRRRMFVSFDDEDIDQAMTLMKELIATAERDGVAAAVEEVRRLLPAEQLRGLTQYALKLFMTHYPPAREQLRFVSLEKRQPNLAFGSSKSGQAVAALTAAAAYPSSATPPEDKVSFWREDPLINEHHEHWHLVYPTSPLPLANRHGELFAYMHEQMLARYDAERLALGLPRVEPYLVYTSAIPQGYDPGKLKLWTGDAWNTFGPRPAGAQLSDLTAPFDTRPGAKLSDQARFRDALTDAATSGSYSLLSPPQKVTIDNLGDTEEANAASVDPAPRKSYGNFHNDGHIHFMAFDNKQPYGVMAETSTAVRDPIFFRWHKQVDDIFHTYQETLPPYDLTKAPKARIRSGDIFLVAAAIPSPAAEAAFGGASWDDGFASGKAGPILLVNELTTEMLTRDIDAVDADGNPVKVPIDYLSHDDFWYVLRVENLEAAPQSVTIRIFIAPEDLVEKREMWIEMDKFVYKLKAHERAVIVRAAQDSSVIRKPALKPKDLTAQNEPDAETDRSAWCDCGWPYTLLVPRGTKSGSPYRIFVMLSFGDELTLPPANGGCSSISYCGLEGKDYPDKMDMGYPFNRPFPKGIETTIAGLPNIATRKLTVRWK
jgi:tyrosinase